MSSRPDVELARQLGQEVRELSLRRRVERRERLVERDHRRVRRERTGDRDPLTLAARELVWKPVGGGVGQPDEAAQLLHAPAARSRARFRPMPSASCEPIERRGLSDEYGFWKTSWRRTRLRGRARRVSAVTGSPSKRTLPAAIGTSPTAARASVDFPHPDSPTSPTICPRSTLRSAPATAAMRAPPRRSYSTTTFSSSSAALIRRAKGSTGTGEAPRVDGHERGHLDAARVAARTRSAGGTSSRPESGPDVGGAPRDRRQRLVGGLRMRQRVEQRARVRVPRPLEHVLAPAGLDDAARVEDRDPVRDRRQHAEVVRDQDDRELVLTP